MRVYQTDQTACHDEAGAMIPCQGAGQDGELKTGAPWPAPRFVVESGQDGDRVRDRLSDRIWTRSAAPFEFPLSWAEAAAAIAALNAERGLGRDDWRLPDRRELFYLVSHARVNPCLPDGHPFADVFPGYYWTGDGCARLPDQAWYVHMGGGRLFKGMKHGSYMVWPVAGTGRAAPMPEPRLTPLGDDSLLDRATGLIWERDADATGGRCDWPAALASAKARNRVAAAGRRDWRLPNIRELESLIDPAAHSPALPPGHGFRNVGDGYWSSTTSAYDPAYAWVLYAEDGPVGVGYKSRPSFYAWRVAGPVASEAGRSDL